MSVSSERREAAAATLDGAQQTKADVVSFAAQLDWDLESAYAVQESLVGRRVERGETVIGAKLGFTSRAKMRQMGVDQVIVGRLTSGMRIADGGALDLGEFIHPKVEPEVAFRLGVDDAGSSGHGTGLVVTAVAPALEIIDSRYRDFKFTFEDVIADNTSAAAFVIGRWVTVQDVSNRAVALAFNGAVAATGSTAAILGDPLRSIAALADVAKERGIPLRDGDIVLAGAATEAISLGAGVVQLEIAGLGRVSFNSFGCSSGGTPRG